jgi:adenosylmethionine-8-amino-7-oxononanoate aminotransferase
VEPSSADMIRLVRHRVRHFGHQPALEAAYPGQYPRMYVSGEGVYLTDDTGRRVLDAGSHLGVCVVGHGRPELADAIAEQVRTLEYNSLDAGGSHAFVGPLADRLAGMVPVADPMFAFTSSGSEANEVAFKMARDYHRRRGDSGRYKVLSRQGSYHGSTLGAVSATSIPEFREPFGPLVPGFLPLPQPFPGYCGCCDFTADTCTGPLLESTAAIIEQEGPETIAAIIAEPISISGAVKVPRDDYWPFLRELCDRHGILLIADEVVNGFGRTGTMFGCEHWNVQPDLLTFAKGITSGYIPMGGVAVGRHVQDVFEGAPFVSINTYSGHPVACAAAMETLSIIEREGLVERAAAGEEPLKTAFTAIAAKSPVPARASVIGLMASIEFFVPSDLDAEGLRRQLWHRCNELGVLLRVTRADNIVTLLFYPPLTIGDDVLADALAQVEKAVAETTTGQW